MKLLSLGEFKDLPLSMQKIMIRWWSVSGGDLFIRSYSDRVPDLEVVNNSNRLDIVRLKEEFVNSNLPSSEVYPIFSEYELRKFLSDYGYQFEIKNWRREGYHVFCYLNDRIHISSKSNSLLGAYWDACIKVLKELSCR